MASCWERSVGAGVSFHPVPTPPAWNVKWLPNPFACGTLWTGLPLLGQQGVIGSMGMEVLLAKK